jgi:hypothetical protein
MEHGSMQAKRFLEAISSQILFEQEWEESLQDKERSLETVMAFFSDDPTIELVPPADASLGRLLGNDGWRVKGSRQVREVLEWCRQHNFTLEQSRDYEVHEDDQNRKVLTCWALATADNFGDPIKGRAEVTLSEGKVEHFAFYPLSSKLMHKLEEELEKLDIDAESR